MTTIRKHGVHERVQHVSTGGAASLAFAGKQDMPGLQAIAAHAATRSSAAAVVSADSGGKQASVLA